MSQIIKTFKNTEDGVRSFIAIYHKGGYSVSIQDMDTEEFLPSIVIFPEIEAAEKAAYKAAFGR